MHLTLFRAGTLANSEYPDEMQHNAAFHPRLHLLLRQIRSLKKEIQYILEITVNSQYIMCNGQSVALWKIPLV